MKKLIFSVLILAWAPKPLPYPYSNPYPNPYPTPTPTPTLPLRLPVKLADLTMTLFNGHFIMRDGVVMKLRAIADEIEAVRIVSPLKNNRQGREAGPSYPHSFYRKRNG